MCWFIVNLMASVSWRLWRFLLIQGVLGSIRCNLILTVLWLLSHWKLLVYNRLRLALVHLLAWLYVYDLMLNNLTMVVILLLLVAQANVVWMGKISVQFAYIAEVDVDQKSDTEINPI